MRNQYAMFQSGAVELERKSRAAVGFANRVMNEMSREAQDFYLTYAQSQGSNSIEVWLCKELETPAIEHSGVFNTESAEEVARALEWSIKFDADETLEEGARQNVNAALKSLQRGTLLTEYSKTQDAGSSPIRNAEPQVAPAV